MTDEEWQQDFARCLGVLPLRRGADETDARGQPMRDDSFLLLFNAHHETHRLPARRHRASRRSRWLRRCVDTAFDTGELAGWRTPAASPSANLSRSQGRSLALLTAGVAAVMKRRHDDAVRRRSCAGTARASGCGRPAAASVELALVRRRRRSRKLAACARGDGDGWFELDVAHGRGERATRFASTASCACPIRRRASTATTCTAPSEVVDPARLRVARRRLARPARGTRR